MRRVRHRRSTAVFGAVLLSSTVLGGVALAVPPSPNPPAPNLSASPDQAAPGAQNTPGTVPSNGTVPNMTAPKSPEPGSPVPPAPGAKPGAPPVTVPGLYGTGDPAADAVPRQALTVLALTADNARPAPQALDWLTGQQCADGGWTVYKADAAPCDPAREDTRATALAVQALHSTGSYGKQVADGRDWLRKRQLPDGSFGDAATTAATVTAFAATGVDPESLRPAQGRSAYEALTAMQAGCGAPENARGSFKLGENPDSMTTAWAAIAATRSGLRVNQAPPVAVAPLVCPAPAPAPPASKNPGVGDIVVPPPTARAVTAQGAAAWLLKQPPGTPSADAVTVLALIATGHPAEALKISDRLAASAKTLPDDPAQLALVSLAASAVNQPPTAFGGVNLLDRLEGAGPKATDIQAPAAKFTVDDDHSLRNTVLGVLGVLLIAAVVLGMRGRKSERE